MRHKFFNTYACIPDKEFERQKQATTRRVIVIDDHEASPSSSDCMTLRSDTRSPVIKMALMLPSISAVILRVKVLNCEHLLSLKVTCKRLVNLTMGASLPATVLESERCIGRPRKPLLWCKYLGPVAPISVNCTVTVD